MFFPASRPALALILLSTAAACGKGESREEAIECESPPGSVTDVANEPKWRSYGDYAPWTDSNGCLVRVDVLAERPGPAHCGFEDTRVLMVGMPLGSPYTSLATTRRYVRDPKGSYGMPELAAGFEPNAKLPNSARDTGFRLGDSQLWHDPEDTAVIYLRRPSSIERWPLGNPPGCD
jgi:hypothetical protein